jgi:ribose 5-phosphate isomerase B
MKVAIAADHAGVQYKEILIKFLVERSFDVLDLGISDPNAADDYPDRAADVAQAIQKHQAERGILICGSAVGVSIAANKFMGIRAGVCHDTYSAHQAVEHDDVNILCLGERVVGIELTKEIVSSFLKAKFSAEARHVKRLEKIKALEEKNLKHGS